MIVRTSSVATNEGEISEVSTLSKLSKTHYLYYVLNAPKAALLSKRR